MNENNEKNIEVKLPPPTEAASTSIASTITPEVLSVFTDLMKNNNKTLMQEIGLSLGYFRDDLKAEWNIVKNQVESDGEETKLLSAELTDFMRQTLQSRSVNLEKDEDYFTPEGSSNGFPSDGGGLTHDLKFAGHFSDSPQHVKTSHSSSRQQDQRRQTDFVRQSTETRESRVRPPDIHSSTVYSVTVEKFTLILEAQDRIKPPTMTQYIAFSKSFAQWKTDNPGAQAADLTQKMGPFLQAQIRENAFSDEISIPDYNNLTNESVLDAVRTLIIPKSPTQFLNMFVDLVRFPVLRDVDSVLQQGLVSSAITAFMNQAGEMFGYLRSDNGKNVPDLATKGKQVGLLECWFYPALAEFGIPFERYFADAKEEHLHNDFRKFSNQVKQINVANKQAASQAARVQKANARYAAKHSPRPASAPSPSPAPFSVLQRSQDARQHPSMHNIDEVADSLSNLSKFQDEPAKKGCFTEIFFGNACTRAGCSFDHSQAITLAWRIFYANQLDAMMNPENRNKKSSVTPAGAPRPSSFNNINLLHTPIGVVPGGDIPTRDSLTEEGKLVYDRLRSKQAEERMQRNSFMEALYLHGLSNSQAASAAHAYNNRKDANHNVKQNATFFSEGDSDDEFLFTYNDPMRGGQNVSSSEK